MMEHFDALVVIDECFFNVEFVKTLQKQKYDHNKRLQSESSQLHEF